MLGDMTPMIRGCLMPDGGLKSRIYIRLLFWGLHKELVAGEGVHPAHGAVKGGCSRKHICALNPRLSAVDGLLRHLAILQTE